MNIRPQYPAFLLLCLLTVYSNPAACAQDQEILAPQTTPNFPPGAADGTPLAAPLRLTPAPGTREARHNLLRAPLPPLAGRATYELATPDPDIYEGKSLLPRSQVSEVFRGNSEVVAPGTPFSLVGAVEFALKNYPKILSQRANILARREGVALQKAEEYTPLSQLEYQEVFASRNKLTQLLWGSEVFPGNPGPGLPNVHMEPYFFSGAGFILDWAPIDFGLHKARISLAKANFNNARAQYGVTELDVAVNAAANFLQTVIAHELVTAAEANVQSFEQFSRQVHAQVSAELKPGADASLADAQLANAQNDLIRARLQYEIAIAGLAESLGLGGQRIEVNPGRLATSPEPPNLQANTPLFDAHPLAVLGKSSILQAAAQRHIWERTYFPTFRFLGGVNTRGSGLNIHAYPQSKNLSGLIPPVPNYNLGFIVDFPFMDYWKIKYEKKMWTREIQVRQFAYDQIIQDLRTQDVQARASVRAAVALAENMPIQVEAALQASQQAEARYQVGLGTVAQVAQANQLLAESRMKEAVARIGVWKSLLQVASVHGNVQPFLAEARKGGLQ